MNQRRSGLLLHITSLPGPLPNGVLGEEARQLMEAMAAAGCRIWQFLPIGPTHGHGSPYETLSTFAGNPELIDLRRCVADGLLSEASLQQVIAGTRSTAEARTEMVEPFRHGWVETEAWCGFLERNACWLEDFALFSAIKQQQQSQAWWQWPEPLRERDPEALRQFSDQHEALLLRIRMEQFLFEQQWQAIRDQAKSLGIILLGDLPIYVAHDSADVWANRDLFTVNDAGLCDEVAGVPPDYFSEDGQRWGNPLYRWERMEANGFSWWIDRVRFQQARVDWLRIDHFRGLEAFWAIPGDRNDGRVGEWRKAPGAALLQNIADTLGSLPLIAEDLGLITPEVEALRTRFGLPGMKILQFAFGGDAGNPYLPHNHSRDSVVYTGTHDNDTTVGWWRQQPEHVRRHLIDYLSLGRDTDEAEVTTALMRQAMASVANLAILPVQDLLRLDDSARLNRPGTVEGNWCWRMSDVQMAALPWEEMADWNRLYGRG